MRGPVCCGHQHQIDAHDIERTRSGHHADGEKKRIARQEQAHQQSGFGEDHGKNRGVAQPSGEESPQQGNQLLGVGQRTVEPNQV
jgi:hypothetical protein